MTDSFDVESNTIAEIDITFPVAFTKNPTVVCTFRSGTQRPEYGNLTVFIDYFSIAKTGCTIKVANASDRTLTPNVMWIACE